MCVFVYCLYAHNECNYFLITALEITSFTSTPDTYGMENQQVTFSCQFMLPPNSATVTFITKWYHNDMEVGTTQANEEYTIPNFRSIHSGNYSCAVLVMVGETVLEGVRSIERTVKLAGSYIHVYAVVLMCIFKLRSNFCALFFTIK